MGEFSLGSDAFGHGDDLGRMELGCAAFRDAVTALLDRPVALVATVHTRSDPFTDGLKRRSSVAVLRLTPSNREELPRVIAQRLGLRSEQ